MVLGRRRRGVEMGRTVELGKDVRLDPEAGGRIVLEDGCALGDGTRIVASGCEVRIGAGARLAERCTLVAHAGIAIGAGALLADGTMAVDFDHVTADPELPVRLQGVRADPVTIGAGARLGPGASVLRGVTIGAGATVGAHAVVTRDVPPRSEVQGVPARAPAAPGAQPPEGLGAKS